MATIPGRKNFIIYAKATIKAPVEAELVLVDTAPTAEGGPEVTFTTKLHDRKVKRFMKKLTRLCKRYGYAVEVEVVKEEEDNDVQNLPD